MITDEKILFDDAFLKEIQDKFYYCLLYTSPSPRDEQ